MTLPKLPEPDGKLNLFLLGEKPMESTDAFLIQSVRAIQEEAYKAGMAAALECTCPAKDMPFGRCAKAMLSAAPNQNET